MARPASGAPTARKEEGELPLVLVRTQTPVHKRWTFEWGKTEAA